jgi:hypothetical protein
MMLLELATLFVSLLVDHTCIGADTRFLSFLYVHAGLLLGLLLIIGGLFMLDSHVLRGRLSQTVDSHGRLACTAIIVMCVGILALEAWGVHTYMTTVYHQHSCNGLRSFGLTYLLLHLAAWLCGLSITASCLY